MYISYITLFLLFATGISFSESYAQVIYDDDFVIEKFATGLNFPTTMTFVNDELLILEKETGKVIKIFENGLKSIEPVLDVAVSNGGESGLIGIESTENHVYLYYTKSCQEDGWDEYSIKFSEYDSSNCISTNFDKPHNKYSKNSLYQYDWNGEKLVNPVLIKEFPSDNIDHAGGIIVANDDNEIYFVIGDQNFVQAESSIMHESGEIIDKNLKTPDYVIATILKIDNTEKNIETFATGIRNSFGLAIDPITGYLWDTENGPNNYDEINLVKKGFNSGWPNQMGPKLDSSTDDYPPSPFVLSGDFVYSDPEFSWTQTTGVTSISFPTIDTFDKYSNWLFVGDFNNGRIYKFQLNEDRTDFIFSNSEFSDFKYDWGEDDHKLKEIIFAEEMRGGVVDIKFHGHYMYVVSIFDGIIYKISPKQIPPPLIQYHNDVIHQDIICKSELMPIMSISNGINCVKPSTALILEDRKNWTLNDSEIPMIELKYQNLQNLNFKNFNFSNSDLRGSDFTNADITNVNFSNANLKEVNLTGADFSNVILTGAAFSNAILTGADFSGKDLSGIDLSGANITKINLFETILVNTNLSNVDLTGVNIIGLNFVGTDLTNTNLSGTDLTNTDLTNTDLTGADLTKSRLIGLDLKTTLFTNSILTGADLTGADLTGADLTNINLSKAELGNTKLGNAILTGADLTNANMFEADLNNAILSKADFTGAMMTEINLSKSKLIETILTGADLTNTNLSGADLTGADLSGADLSRSNLIGIDFTTTIVSKTIFDDARLIGVNLSNLILSRSSFEGANLSNSNLSDSNFKNANLSGADLTNTNFSEANLSGADLTNTKFSKANLSEANLSNTNLSEAYIVATDLTGADLTGADLTGADLTGADLTGADLTGADLTGADLSKTILACNGNDICDN